MTKVTNLGSMTSRRAFDFAVMSRVTNLTHVKNITIALVRLLFGFTSSDAF